jgi:hypothetical protein
VEGDLRTSFVEDEPPGIPKDGSASDVNTDDHVTEEKPRSDERFAARTRRSLHDLVVWGIKAKRCRWKTTIECVRTDKLLLKSTNSVIKFTQRSWTGINASGMPSRTVRKIETTSPMLDEMR